MKKDHLTSGQVVMADKRELAADTVSQLLKRLNQALRLEYSLIIHYPYIVNLLRNEEVKKLATGLGAASIHHADVVATLISKLGGEPEWSFEPFPEGTDTLRIFRIQLAKERLALQLHKGSAELSPTPSHSKILNALAEEEELESCPIPELDRQPE
jgi:bacterioferritin (cytochrome b1)